MLLGEFATRAERAGWLTLHRELGDRHRDDLRLAEAIAEDCDALLGRADALAAVGQAVERGARWLRPKRVGVGGISLDPSYTADTPAAADVMKRGFAQLDAVLSHTERPGALLLYDEAHLLADERSRERFPLSTLLAALGAVQREHQRVRIILCGLPTLSLNLKRARTYAERMFRHVGVGNLELDAAEEALAIPLVHRGRSFQSVPPQRDLRTDRWLPVLSAVRAAMKRRVIRVGCHDPPASCRSRMPKLRAA